MHYKNVVSFFDGMSGGQVALLKAGDTYDNYYAVEFDKNAIRATQNNFPNTKQMGDIRKLLRCDFPDKIDLVLAGSPCQGFSFAGKRLGFKDPRSRLFFKFVRLLRQLNPTYFLLENVRMSTKELKVITNFMGVDPVFIDSALVCGAYRKRWYWTNINDSYILQPEDRKIFLSDILEHGVTDRLKSFCLVASDSKGTSLNRYVHSGKRKSQIVFKDKQTIRKSFKEKPIYEAKNNNPFIKYNRQDWRNLTVIERLRLQGFLDNYCEGIPKTHAVKMTGNGWQADTIEHILRHNHKNKPKISKVGHQTKLF